MDITVYGWWQRPLRDGQQCWREEEKETPHFSNTQLAFSLSALGFGLWGSVQIQTLKEKQSGLLSYNGSLYTVKPFLIY